MLALTQGAEQGGQGGGGQGGAHDLTAGRQVVHEAAGLSVGSVDGTQEAPGLGQQLTHRGGPHLGERRSSVHAAEVGQVADEIELVGHHAQAGVLQHAETWGRSGRDRSGSFTLTNGIEKYFFMVCFSQRSQRSPG